VYGAGVSGVGAPIIAWVGSAMEDEVASLQAAGEAGNGSLVAFPVWKGY